MILHPDGRIEGTPDELASYQKLTAGPKEPVPIIEPIPRIVPNPYRDASPSPFPWPQWVPGPLGPVWSGDYGSTSATYKANPNIVAWN